MLLAVEILHKNVHRSDGLASESKRRKVLDSHVSANSVHFSQHELMSKLTEKIPVVLSNRPNKTVNKEQSTRMTTLDVQEDTNMEGNIYMDMDEKQESECLCGYLHGPGQGSHDDPLAIGLGIPLLRGPD